MRKECDIKKYEAFETLWNEILRYETVSWKVDVKEKIISLSNEIIASQVDYLPYYYVDIWQDARIEIRVMLRRRRSWFKCGVETLFRSLTFIKEH